MSAARLLDTALGRTRRARERARLYDALGYPPGPYCKEPIAWVWNWNQNPRAWCSPDHLPRSIKKAIIAGRQEDSLGEVYLWTLDGLEPGDELACSRCGAVIYRKPEDPKEDPEP